MIDTHETPQQFFERYAAALLARDEKAVAAMYAVPALILFPGRSIVVTDARQTEDFFASAWAQYAGVDTVEKKIAIMGESPASRGGGPASVWADVTWLHDGRERERFCYQLVRAAGGYQIAVLTPLMPVPG